MDSKFTDDRVKEQGYEARVIELFSSWLDHWSTRINKQTHEVYGAWDECRERAQKETKDVKSAYEKGKQDGIREHYVGK